MTAADVSKAAAKYLKPDNATCGLFIPTKSPDRTTVPMLADLAKVDRQLQGRQDIALGEAFDPSPENIDKHTKTETLPSGIKAAFLEKKTRGHEVHMRLTLRYGDVKNLHGKLTAGQVLPHLMIRGTKSLSHQQIQDELDKLQGDAARGGLRGRSDLLDRDAAGIVPGRVEALGQDPSRADAAGKRTRTPQAAEWRSWKRRHRSADAGTQRRPPPPGPLSERGSALRRHAARVDRDAQGGYGGRRQEALRELPERSARRAGDRGRLRRRPDGPDPRFDSCRLEGRDAVCPYFPQRQSESTGGYKQIETPDKANAMYFGALVFPMKDDDSDFAPLSLGDFILGSGTLCSRLGDRIREKEGLSYGVASTLGASAQDRRTSMSVFAICNPANMEKVRKGIAEEIARLLDKGIPEAELAAAKKGFLQQEQLARTQDAGLGPRPLREPHGRPFDEVLHRTSKSRSAG